MSGPDSQSHRTLEWAERTHQPGRAGPIRGGLRTDYRARTEVAVAVAVVAVALAALAALPARSPDARQGTGPLVSGPNTRIAPSPPPAAWTPRNSPTAEGAGGPWYLRSVPPPAPVWLDGPMRETPLLPRR